MKPILLATLLLVACGGSPPAPTSAGPAPTAPTTPPPGTAVRNVGVDVLKQAEDDGKVPVLVDVRTPQEFASGHVPGAVNVPIDTLSSRMAELDPYKAGDVYVICQAGGRSAAASTSLAQAGYHPLNVQGGTAAWKAAGYPTE